MTAEFKNTKILGFRFSWNEYGPHFEVDSWPSKARKAKNKHFSQNIFNCVTKYFSLFYKIFLPSSGEAVCEVECVGYYVLHVGEVGGAVGGRGQPGRHGEVDTAGPGSIAHHTGGRT